MYGHKNYLLLVLPIVASQISAPAVDAQVRLSSGRITKFDAVDASGSPSACTPFQSFRYTTVPDMVVAFTIPGPRAHSVLVQFQASIKGGQLHPDRTLGVIRLTIDGIPQPGSGKGPILVWDEEAEQAIPSETGGSPVGTHGFNFVSGHLDPGQHTARIQWMSTNPDEPICAFQRTMVVLHD